MVVAILAGGQSRRMGTDKAYLDVDGTPLLERAARLALTSGFATLVVGRARPADWLLDGVDFVEDALPGRGPLGGLETALRLGPTPVLALACDMPLLTPDALRWLTDESALRRGEHGLAVRNSGRWEPLFSVYSPACLALVEARLAAGRLSLHGLIEAGNFALADAPDWVASQLVNVNTPADPGPPPRAKIIPSVFQRRDPATRAKHQDQLRVAPEPKAGGLDIAAVHQVDIDRRGDGIRPQQAGQVAETNRCHHGKQVRGGQIGNGSRHGLSLPEKSLREVTRHPIVPAGVLIDRL